MRKTALLWLVLAAICGAILFQTSQHVTDGRTKLAGIEAGMQKEEASLRVLQAEWSYLNGPDRLEKLAKKYLALEPLKGAQFGKVEALADRPPEVAAAPQAEVAVETPVVPQAVPVPQTPAAVATAKPVEKPAAPKPAGSKTVTVGKLPVIVLKPEVAVTSPILKPVPQQPRTAPSTASAWREPSRTAGSRDFKDVIKSLGVQ